MNFPGYQIVDIRTASTGTQYLTLKRERDDVVFRVRAGDHAPSLERFPVDLLHFGVLDDASCLEIAKKLDKQNVPDSKVFELVMIAWQKEDAAKRKAERARNDELFHKRCAKLRAEYPVEIDVGDLGGKFNSHAALQKIDYKVARNLLFFRSEEDLLRAKAEFVTYEKK